MEVNIFNQYILEEKVEGSCFYPDKEQCYMGVVNKEALPLVSQLFAIEDGARQCLSQEISCVESHDGFYCIILNSPGDFRYLMRSADGIKIYFRKELLLFVCDDEPILDRMLVEIQDGSLRLTNLERGLYLFLERLISGESLLLEEIEQEISDLEEELMTKGNEDCLNTIIYLRKKLLAQKHYYGHLLAICEALEENDNEIIHDGCIRYFRILTSKVERLCHDLLNLRDYVTQVREAYQAQVDIKLNQLMKMFTVITAIFSPLTLIVGWYGMNVQMPEVSWRYGYPFVIVLCIAVVVLCVMYFKKHKWF